MKEQVPENTAPFTANHHGNHESKLPDDADGDPHERELSDKVATHHERKLFDGADGDPPRRTMTTNLTMAVDDPPLLL
ncbi:hypothetical protein SESBI_04246 [Sesbania bispinosa]|nr:hypothetical protein SESBI_04246 [Sesbania bispinosa]